MTFVYLPQKIKPEKQDTKSRYRASLAATPVPCSISSIEIQLRSEPISPRPVSSTWKIHEHEHRPSVLVSPSTRDRSTKLPVAIKPWLEVHKRKRFVFQTWSIKLRVHVEVS